jgi:benzoyl-CoA 2,3-dioxygenase component B
VRAAGAIDLPTIQRYLNFHYSVTIDLFGADQSEQRRHLLQLGPEGPLRGRQAHRRPRAQGPDLQGARVQGGQLVEKDVPMLNALNEVLRDDFIKDSVAGVERWNKVLEKAGIPTRLTVPHKAFNRQIGALAGIKMSPKAAW